LNHGAPVEADPEELEEPDQEHPDTVVIPGSPPEDDSISFDSSGFVTDSGIASSADLSGIPGSAASTTSEDKTVKIYKLVSTPLGSENRSGSFWFFYCRL